MSDGITDRRPTHEDDGPMVYGPDGNICHLAWIKDGDAWKPIPKCEPYVKPKRFYAWWDDERGWWMIEREVQWFEGQWFEWLMRLDKQNDEYREAAERIAAIYDEVIP